MDKKLLQGLLSFSAGFGLAAVLILGLGAGRFLPASVALALLSFACGVLVMQFLALRKAEKAARAAEDHWLNEFNKMEEEKCEAEALLLKRAKELEEQRSELERDKSKWEIKKQVSKLFEEAAVAEPPRTLDEEGGGDGQK